MVDPSPLNWLWITCNTVEELVRVTPQGKGLPLEDRRARQALNLAVDRDALVRDAMCGHSRPLAGLTPPTALTVVHRAGSRLEQVTQTADAPPHELHRAATGADGEQRAGPGHWSRR